VKNSVEAAAFYAQAFGMTIGYNVKHDNGTYLHAELEKDGRPVFAVSESDDPAVREATIRATRPTMSLGISLSDEAELSAAYEALSQGGHVIFPLGPLPWTPGAADVVDKFGVCWYIYVSQHKPDEA
jgi:uncharacterized glyoxalase superfamily protein PhnB